MNFAIAPLVDTGEVSNRRKTILALAGVTALAEVASVLEWLPDLQVGDLGLSMSLVPALVLAVVIGPRLLGRSASRRAAIFFWAAIAIAIPVLAILMVRQRSFGIFTGLVAAALGEELVYRLAVPAVLAAALRVGAVRPGPARIAGFVGAAVFFTLLPGHTSQVNSIAGLLPFISFAAIAAFVVYRSGSILPMAAVHAISNLLTVLMWRDAVPADARSLSLSCLFGLLVLAYGKPRPITVGDSGGLVDTRTGLSVISIDLRNGRPATVELADGQVVQVHDDMARPADLPLFEDKPSSTLTD